VSSDDGWIIRQNASGKYVLQHFFMSSEELPPVEDGGFEYDTLDDAVRQYARFSKDYPSEYGLSVNLNLNESEDKMALDIKQYARKPFFVDAVQITADNMEEVALWCAGEIREEEPDHEGATPTKYVHVRVHRPLNERQSRGYIGDWVLYAGTGYKVYNNKAFNNSFDPSAGTEKVTNVFDAAVGS
jgi:hypothetical protein